MRAVAHVALMLIAGLWPAMSAAADAPRRIVSINMCMDQLLIDLADREQIVGLSPFAHDARRSWVADRAQGLRALSGTAEEIIDLKPDLVLTGRFTKRATNEIVQGLGFRMVEFDAVTSIEDAKSQIRLVSALVGHPARGEARVAEIEAALDRLRASVRHTGYRVLPLQRRGWVSGERTLTSSLLESVGLRNVATELGLRQGGFLGLEAIVALRPDFLLLSREPGAPQDQGQALLTHPAIAVTVPAHRRLYMPEHLTVCGGPMLATTIDALAAELDRVSPRASTAARDR